MASLPQQKTRQELQGVRLHPNVGSITKSMLPFSPNILRQHTYTLTDIAHVRGCSRTAADELRACSQGTRLSGGPARRRVRHSYARRRRHPHRGGRAGGGHGRPRGGRQGAPERVRAPQAVRHRPMPSEAGFPSLRAALRLLYTCAAPLCRGSELRASEARQRCAGRRRSRPSTSRKTA